MPPSGAVALGAFLAAYAVVENNFACCRWLAGRCFGLDLWRRKTTVECAETDYNRRLLARCSRLLDFKPPFWAQGPLLQLYLAIMCPAPQIEYHKETIGMRDGGHVQLDWAEQPGSKRDAPVLLVLHGIAGHSQERYMRRMVHEMRSHGWMVVVYNRRGHIALDGKRLDAALGVRAGLSELEAELPSMHRHKLPPPLPEDSDEGSSSDGIFHTAHSASLRPLDAIEAAGGAARGAPVAVALAPAPGGGAGAFAVEPDVAHSVVRAWPLYSDVDDMTAVVRHVRARQGDTARLFAVGFSAGSNCLAKYVGETGAACPLTAAAVVANGFDIRKGLEFIRKNARLLDRMIAYNLQNLYQRCSQDIDKHAPVAVEAKAVKRCRSVRDIDTVITSRIYGVDVDAYYDSQSSITCMPEVAIPMLCINARDDPLIDPALVATASRIAKKNDHIVSVLTSHGGHLGWVAGWRRQWMCPAIGEFFRAADALAVGDALGGKGWGGAPGKPA